MLRSLRIRNLALLEAVDLEFEPGFTAVTGETGAGKSVLLGALALLAGERADRAVVRQGAAACEVEASLWFADPGRIDARLAELELPACEEGTLILKRSLPRERPPKITVNGSLAPLSALQRLAELWIDFHGPGEPRRLLKGSCQVDLLDLFGGTGTVLAAYREAYDRWRALGDEQDRIAAAGRLSPDEAAYLQAQLDRLDGLDLTEEAIAALERDFGRMSRAQEIIGLAAGLEAGLAGDEGAGSQVALLVREARRLESIDPQSRALAERLANASVELSDLAAEFGSLSRSLAADPDLAAGLESRMAAWLDARRRHGGDVRSVARVREEMRRRLEMRGDVEGTLARLAVEIAAAEAEARRRAARLRTARGAAAAKLARAASSAIAGLGFRKADFSVELSPPGDLGPAGDGGCSFLFSPNVGEPPLALSRIASSGELARVMLALKTILADLDGVALLVFDEVDANVGGEIGGIVGDKMAAIGAGHQVLCVTHLPQVAARAANHLVVLKDQSGDRAVVTIEGIHADRRGRVRELARMLGDRGARSAIAHAEELLGKTAS